MNAEQIQALDANLASQIGDDVSVVYDHESLFKQARVALQAALTAMAERDKTEAARAEEWRQRREAQDNAGIYKMEWAEMRRERDALQARVNALEVFVGDFADAKFEPLPMPRAKSPEDEPDPVVDATEVWAWQQDARALLSKGSPDADA